MITYAGPTAHNSYVAANPYTHANEQIVLIAPCGVITPMFTNYAAPLILQCITNPNGCSMASLAIAITS